MTKDNTLKRIIEILSKEFPIKKAFLFGSRANGTSSSDSDYDLLFIIHNSSISKIERMQKAHLALWDAKIDKSTDIFIYTQDEFNQSKELLNTVPEIVTNQGQEIPLDSL